MQKKSQKGLQVQEGMRNSTTMGMRMTIKQKLLLQKHVLHTEEESLMHQPIISIRIKFQAATVITRAK